MSRPRFRVQVLLIVLLAGCTASPGASTGASSAPSPSAGSPSAAPSQPASPAHFPTASLPPDSRAELTKELAISALPGGDAIGTLDAGTAVGITAGPRDVAGGTWYEVLWPPGSNSSRGGWVRVDDASALKSVEQTCPETAGEVLAMPAWDRVRCFGGVAVTVEGTVGHCQGGVVEVEPGWLGYACWAVSDDTGTMDLHADPASGVTFPDELVRARITGHFDDPAATSCTFLGEPDPAGRTPSASEQVFLCRESFVVDTFEVLEVTGTPPAA